MKIGINLVGVSYNDGTIGRYRNYEDAIDGFMTNIINPLIEEGHDVFSYLYTYDSPKKDDIIKTYTPVKSSLLNPDYNKMSSGVVLENKINLQSAVYINSLMEILNENLDLVISTRFDINFFKNPFKEYQYDLNKCNFLWREPEYTHLPIVNDTFIVFPHHMTQNFINTIMIMETNPPHGVNVAMHNLYLPMCMEVGKENVQWVSDKFETAISNTLYKLMRNE